jgi:hypothetical protein
LILSSWFPMAVSSIARFRAPPSYQLGTLQSADAPGHVLP